MRKILFLIIVSLFLISLASAETSFGTYKQNECINISIVSDGTSCTISSIKYPNSNNILTNTLMNKNGNDP